MVSIETLTTFFKTEVNVFGLIVTVLIIYMILTNFGLLFVLSSPVLIFPV